MWRMLPGKIKTFQTGGESDKGECWKAWKGI
jgi:hypothetical protein